MSISCREVSPGDFALEVGVGAAPNNTKKAKKARNAKKAAGKVLREEGLRRRVPGGSVESEEGHFESSVSKTNYLPSLLL